MRLLVILLASIPLQADWKAGVGRADITPSESVWMAGYGARTKPSEGVRQHIWVKALALQDSSHATSVLVTLDLVGIRRGLAEDIAKEVARLHGIKRDHLLFNASHTHSAPLASDVSSYVDMMGNDADKQVAAVRRYTTFLRGKILESIKLAVNNLQPATLRFEQGFAGFAVNRRRVGNRHYPGPVDHDVPVLAVHNGQNTLQAVVFGYACHNTVLGDYLINGDYAGYAQEALEKAFPGATALFVQNAGADSNPLPRRSEALARRYGETLSDAVSEVVKGKMKPVEEPLRTVLEYTDLHFKKPATKAELEEQLNDKEANVRGHAKRLLARLKNEGSISDIYSYPVQAWRFGNTFTLLALAGELVVDYSLRFKAKYGWNELWIAGYSNDVFGYVPSLRVLREGGYEGGAAMLFTSLPGPFAEDVEETIAAKVEQVIKKAKADAP